jgi:hypothetical protein
MEERVVPDDIAACMILKKSLTILRDIYVRLPFCYRLAKRASFEAERAEALFCQKIGELYPETRRSKTLKYDIRNKLLRWDVEDE